METILEFQRLIEEIYFERDSRRGIDGTFRWFIEEVGELARSLRRIDDKSKLKSEFADVFAWLASLASISGVELSEAVKKYEGGCPKCCGGKPCRCII